MAADALRKYQKIQLFKKNASAHIKKLLKLFQLFFKIVRGCHSILLYLLLFF